MGLSLVIVFDEVKITNKIKNNILLCNNIKNKKYVDLYISNLYKYGLNKIYYIVTKENVYKKNFFENFYTENEIINLDQMEKEIIESHGENSDEEDQYDDF